ncbi:5059_t:CDS:2 [Funneliformis caledonium]|uniref:5059_t:CDS:1 n=1 Tax=Funneliformis caledonium TaxID=1117310 RepID=A0A9N9A810_9GLOM|nr:5059_t:CDS:2 [Funneliformis caledonium]
MASPINPIYINIGESIPSSPITSKHRVEKPVLTTATTDVPMKESKETPCEDEGCVMACRTIFIKSKRVFEILTYFRLAVAITLYILITIDLISIKQKKEKVFWVINAEFTLLTIIAHPKRIINLPRAIKICIASRYLNYRLSDLFPPNIKETQKNVYRSYDWYLYEATKADLICSPRKLLVVLLFWNVGSLVQYGICVILWFFPQQERPMEIYITLNAVALICEIFPIPLVVKQYKKTIKARRSTSNRRYIR